MYNRTEPIIPLGMLSMLVQGVVMAYLYPQCYRAAPQSPSVWLSDGFNQRGDHGLRRAAR